MVNGKLNKIETIFDVRCQVSDVGSLSELKLVDWQKVEGKNW